MDREAGDRLRRFVDDRMAAAGVDSLVDLADRADIGRDTLYAWFRGRSPTPAAGGKVARVLGVSYRELLDAFEGTTPNDQPPPGDALLVTELRSQTAATVALTERVSELVDLLRPMAEAQALQVADLQRAVQRLYALVTPGEAGLPAPRETEG